MRATDFLTEEDHIPNGPSWIRIDGIDYWQDTQPSVATRSWAPTSRHVGRSSLPYVSGATTGIRKINFESLLESDTAVVLAARRDIVNLVEQPPAVTYFDHAAQKWRTHVFDLLATHVDGTKTAIDVRAHGRDAALRRIVKAIADQGCGLADAYAVVTNADLPRNLVRNSELIRAVRRDHDRTADEKIRAIVKTLVGAVTIKTLVTASGLEGKGFRAIVRLIDEGDLTIDQQVLIDYPAMVRRPKSWRAAA